MPHEEGIDYPMGRTYPQCPFSYALNLVAKWREPRAYPYVIRWLSLPEEEPKQHVTDLLPGGRLAVDDDQGKTNVTVEGPNRCGRQVIRRELPAKLCMVGVAHCERFAHPGKEPLKQIPRIRLEIAEYRKAIAFVWILNVASDG